MSLKSYVNIENSESFDNNVIGAHKLHLCTGQVYQQVIRPI